MIYDYESKNEEFENHDKCKLCPLLTWMFLLIRTLIFYVIRLLQVNGIKKKM
jgi:hypothetical protein